MSDEFHFNPEQQEGSDFELIPPGDYVAQIIEAEIRQPKSGDGHMLALTWKICEGEYENRQVWDTLLPALQRHGTGHRPAEVEGYLHCVRHHRAGQRSRSLQIQAGEGTDRHSIRQERTV
jgi:hypothetical protein